MSEKTQPTTNGVEIRNKMGKGKSRRSRVLAIALKKEKRQEDGQKQRSAKNFVKSLIEMGEYARQNDQNSSIDSDPIDISAHSKLRKRGLLGKNQLKDTMSYSNDSQIQPQIHQILLQNNFPVFGSSRLNHSGMGLSFHNQPQIDPNRLNYTARIDPNLSSSQFNLLKKYRPNTTFDYLNQSNYLQGGSGRGLSYLKSVWGLDSRFLLQKNSAFLTVKSKITQSDLKRRTRNVVKLSDYLHIPAEQKFDQIYDFLVSNRQFRFVDDIFCGNGSSLVNNMLRSDKLELGNLKWMRISEIYKKYSPVLFAKNFDDRDLVPGYLESSALAYTFSCLGHANSLASVFPNDQIYNIYGIYSVSLFVNDKPVEVIVDDLIPCVQLHGDHYEPAFTKMRPIGRTVEIWPHILAKAISKHLGSYENLTNLKVFDLLRMTVDGVPMASKIEPRSVLGFVEGSLKNGDFVLLRRKFDKMIHEQLCDVESTLVLGVEHLRGGVGGDEEVRGVETESGDFGLVLKNCDSFDDLNRKRMEALSRISGNYVNKLRMRLAEVVNVFAGYQVLLSRERFGFGERFEVAHKPGGFGCFRMILKERMKGLLCLSQPSEAEFRYSEDLRSKQYKPVTMRGIIIRKGLSRHLRGNRKSMQTPEITPKYPYTKYSPQRPTDSKEANSGKEWTIIDSFHSSEPFLTKKIDLDSGIYKILLVNEWLGQRQACSVQFLLDEAPYSLSYLRKACVIEDVNLLENLIIEEALENVKASKERGRYEWRRGSIQGACLWFDHVKNTSDRLTLEFEVLFKDSSPDLFCSALNDLRLQRKGQREDLDSVALDLKPGQERLLIWVSRDPRSSMLLPSIRITI